MRVLVTGATGFVGFHLVKRLVSAGDEVTCLVRSPKRASAISGFGPRLAEGDVTRPDSLKGLMGGFDAVYHLAGVIRAVGPDALEAVNRDGTRNVVAACAEAARPPTVVLVSSIAAAGPTRGTAHDERTEPHPISDYGRSKLAGEQAVRAFAHRVPITIVRPAVVFGERDRELFSFFRLATRGYCPAPGGRDARLSLMHVADLCHLLEVVCLHGERLHPEGGEAGGPSSQGLYYAAGVEQPTYGELAEHLAAIYRRDVRPVSAPAAVTWGAALLSETVSRLRRRATLLNLDKAREVSAGEWRCDASKALKSLPLKLRMGLRERLNETAAWYREAGWLSTGPVLPT